MQWLNSQDRYGALTKFFHWLIVALFAFQFVAASIMQRMTPAETTLGLGQNTYYNWHKSIGLIALAVALGRILNRRHGRLPDWAPGLSAREQNFIHRTEQVLYAAMFVMPVSGFLHVMAGGYGVRLFGVIDLPNPIGAWPGLASAAKLVHRAGGFAMLAALAGHLGLVLRHQIWLGDGLLYRMLPSRTRRP